MKFDIAGARSRRILSRGRYDPRGSRCKPFSARSAPARHCRARRARDQPSRQFRTPPQVTDCVAALGEADIVFLAVKAHSLPDLAPRLVPVLAPQASSVSLQNGIPWWFPKLERVDPARDCGGHRVEPGVVRHVEGRRLSIGEPGGSRSERCRATAAALVSAGLRCPITTHIREEIWVKLLGNAAFNPISALTNATLARVVADPDVAALAHEMMARWHPWPRAWALSCR